MERTTELAACLMRFCDNISECRNFSQLSSKNRPRLCIKRKSRKAGGIILLLNKKIPAEIFPIIVANAKSD
jgi:hypothetical protein